jgi:hypothetical protein
VARPQAAAAAAEREAWLRGKVEASVFARWLQDVEDGCLGCVRRVLQAEVVAAGRAASRGRGRPPATRRRRRRRGEGEAGGLEPSMRKAEAEVRRTQDMEVSLLVKSFFEAPVEAVRRLLGQAARATARARGDHLLLRRPGLPRAPP